MVAHGFDSHGRALTAQGGIPVPNIMEHNGWMVCYTDCQDATSNLYELQKNDDIGAFKSDLDAIRFVSRMAIENPQSKEADAVRFLIINSPNEIDSMFRSVIGKDVEILVKILTAQGGIPA